MDEEIIAKLLLQIKKDEKGHLEGQSAYICKIRLIVKVMLKINRCNKK